MTFPLSYAIIFTVKRFEASLNVNFSEEAMDDGADGDSCNYPTVTSDIYKDLAAS